MGQVSLRFLDPSRQRSFSNRNRRDLRPKICRLIFKILQFFAIARDFRVQIQTAALEDPESSSEMSWRTAILSNLDSAASVSPSFSGAVGGLSFATVCAGAQFRDSIISARSRSGRSNNSRRVNRSSLVMNSMMKSL